MARIRTIKPEFFTSESVCSVSPLARLLFIGLWCEADREGRLKWKPQTLKIRYLPVDDCDILQLSSELIAEGMLSIYEDDGVKYCEIPAFKSHQVINNRERESEIPPRVHDASPREKAEGRKEGKGREGKGKEGKEDKAPTEPIDFAPLGMSVDQVSEVKRIRRKNKGGSLTQRVVNALAKEFNQACSTGYSFDELLTEWELRGWKSFKAEWIKPKAGQQQFTTVTQNNIAMLNSLELD